MGDVTLSTGPLNAKLQHREVLYGLFSPYLLNEEVKTEPGGNLKVYTYFRTSNDLIY